MCGVREGVAVTMAVLVLTFVAPHAAHHPGHSTRPASDLATWKVRSASKPTHAELRALGVPVDAEYHYGEFDPDGRQYWYYARSQPAKDATCSRCAP